MPLFVVIATDKENSLSLRMATREQGAAEIVAELVAEARAVIERLATFTP